MGDEIALAIGDWAQAPDSGASGAQRIPVGVRGRRSGCRPLRGELPELFLRFAGVLFRLPGLLPDEVPGRLAEQVVGPPPSAVPRHRSRTWVAVQTRPLPLAEVRDAIEPLIAADRDVPIYPILTS